MQVLSWKKLFKKIKDISEKFVENLKEMWIEKENFEKNPGKI